MCRKPVDIFAHIVLKGKREELDNAPESFHTNYTFFTASPINDYFSTKTMLMKFS